jgi:hypothetical protein
MFAGYIAAFPSRGLFAAVNKISDSTLGGVYNTTATSASPWFKSGETNRYTKSRESRVVRATADPEAYRLG